jgi:hypothetical protein
VADAGEVLAPAGAVARTARPLGPTPGVARAGARAGPSRARCWRPARGGSGRPRSAPTATRRGSPGGRPRRGRLRRPRSPAFAARGATAGSARPGGGCARRAPRRRGRGRAPRRPWRVRGHGVVRLVERQPPRRPRLAARGELVLRARSEGAGDVVARRALTARHLGVRGGAADPLEHVPTEATRDALAGWQLGMGLGERAPATPTAIAALAPHQVRDPSSDRQVAHPHYRAALTSTDERPQ